MKQLTDEELCQVSGPTRTDAEAELLNRYQSVASAIARTYKVHRLDVDDLESEAMIAVVMASRKWQPGNGCRFASFCRDCINKKLIDLYRRASKLAEVPLSACVRLDQPVPGEDDMLIEDCVPSGVDIHADLECREFGADVYESHTVSAWPLLRDGMMGLTDAILTNSSIEDRVMVAQLFDAMIAVCKSQLTEREIEMVSRVLRPRIRTQNALFEMPYAGDDKEASECARRIFERFSEVGCNVMAAIEQGYTESDISAMLGVPKDALRLVLKSIRANTESEMLRAA